MSQIIISNRWKFKIKFRLQFTKNHENNNYHYILFSHIEDNQP